MKTKTIAIQSIFFVLFCTASMFGCDKEYKNMDLFLMAGDTYNFSEVGYTAKPTNGDAAVCRENVLTAEKAGEVTVELTDEQSGNYKCHVTVYDTVEELGNQYPLDRGMFAGKKAVVFGDSITDGADCSHYDNYFGQLCRYLGIVSDPTDSENVNFALGGTTVTYPGGVNRVSQNAYMDFRGRRNPYPNICVADLCVIFYGTNDFYHNRYIKSPDERYSDTPESDSDALTVKGGFFYMVRKMRGWNPDLKFILLPPLYRCDSAVLYSPDGNFTFNDDKSDVKNNITGEWLSSAATAVEEVAEDLGAKFVNWYSLFSYENFSAGGGYTSDGIHPNKEAHEVMFRYLMEHR